MIIDWASLATTVLVGFLCIYILHRIANARFASYKERLNRDRMRAVAGWLKAMASRDRPPSNHRWRAIFSWESPKTCDICGKNIYVAGETWRRKALAAILIPSRAERQQQGCECVICSQVAHFYCAHRHAHRVPCRWDFTDYPPNHRWLRGNLMVEGMNCQVCYKPCDSEDDYRCVMCRRFVHAGKCREKIGPECDLGPLGFACLKPACFVDIPNSTSRARTQSDVDGTLSPRDSTHCSTPLVVEPVEPATTKWSITKFSLGLYKLLETARGRRKSSTPMVASPSVADPPVVTPSFTVSREACIACDTTSPVLCFINPRSGGLQGRRVRDMLYGTLHPRQVVDVTKAGQPRAALLSFSSIADTLRVLVCGGDGTVGWILGELEAVYGAEQLSKVPVSVMPMGTGNDLSAILGCGREMDLSEVSMRTAMAARPEGRLQRLDRWNVKFDYYRSHNRIKRSLSAPRLYGEFVEDEDYTAGLDSALQVLSPETEDKVVINYLDIGAAARIAGQFHHHRETFPELFTTRFENKVRYGELGFADFLVEEPVSLKDVSLLCDGVPVQLPCNGDLADIIIVNIPSFAGAVDLWGSTSPHSRGYRRQRIDDGIIEVVAVSSLFHLGKVQVGLSSPYAVCQGKEITLSLSTGARLPAQLDGEPYSLLGPCELTVSRKDDALMVER
ncbi:diacylglycerol kinase, putative [Perkinsus marinus ATCC 50983]|uniref:Diacylglycerol kinase n=1 Tax=Perkinsus marinus (strain ATCC 50983 / TXsc) TaxID=423536 RepID=C5LLC7_PERM5|nr:diacylglycerol kinase, putative [Perkinsus marinus ATCC 50983]EER02486.1 diacylglycerol kinase, putative [Perkinsus marinus ATCC 50983]|eukprot:XP_002769768.1 diacylglycerol kinase, putative [Perkinsus marinus ATCC 50983]